MLKESLPEYLKVAEFCINYRKDTTWGADQAGGCLGYPGTSLMFCILDTIGSYHRGRKDFFVDIEGKKRNVINDSYHHFFMLNSDYYKQRLTEDSIKRLYDNYRNLLLHNAVLAEGHILFWGESSAAAFPTYNSRPHINVAAFLRISREAVDLFLPQIEDVVSKSDQLRIVGLKR
jgi:hypothetical protein